MFYLFPVLIYIGISSHENFYFYLFQRQFCIPSQEQYEIHAFSSNLMCHFCSGTFLHLCSICLRDRFAKLLKYIVALLLVSDELFIIDCTLLFLSGVAFVLRNILTFIPYQFQRYNVALLLVFLESSLSEYILHSCSYLVWHFCSGTFFTLMLYLYNGKFCLHPGYLLALLLVFILFTIHCTFLFNLLCNFCWGAYLQ